MKNTLERIIFKRPNPRFSAKLKPQNRKYYVFVTTDEFKDLINSLAENAADTCMDIQKIGSNKTYVLIKDKQLLQFINKHKEFKSLFDKLNDGKHQCYNCGCISNVFFLDYRGQHCLSKVFNCEFCHSLNDKDYDELSKNRLIEKYI